MATWGREQDTPCHDPPPPALMSSSSSGSCEIPVQGKAAASIPKRKGVHRGEQIHCKRKRTYFSPSDTDKRDGQAGWREAGATAPDKGPFTPTLQNWLKPGWRAESGMMMRQAMKRGVGWESTHPPQLDKEIKQVGGCLLPPHRPVSFPFFFGLFLHFFQY